jgi:TrmH family RNA methyltransferase
LDKITSLSNPAVKRVVALPEDLILIEGRHPVEEAIAAGLEIETIYVREDQTPWGNCVIVTKAVMAKMATTDSPPPVLAVAKRPSSHLSHGRLLGLVGLQDPGNIGTLIRAACAFGITGILLIGDSCDPYHPKVIRASAGLIFRLPVAMVTNLDSVLSSFNDLSVFAADAHEGKSYKDIDYGDHPLLLLGSEAHGLPPEVLAHATPLHIPMHSSAESLNVAMAGAIILSEMYQSLVLLET